MDEKKLGHGSSARNELCTFPREVRKNVWVWVSGRVATRFYELVILHALKLCNSFAKNGCSTKTMSKSELLHAISRN